MYLRLSVLIILEWSFSCFYLERMSRRKRNSKNSVKSHSILRPKSSFRIHDQKSEDTCVAHSFTAAHEIFTGKRFRVEDLIVDYMKGNSTVWCLKQFKRPTQIFPKTPPQIVKKSKYSPPHPKSKSKNTSQTSKNIFRSLRSRFLPNTHQTHITQQTHIKTHTKHTSNTQTHIKHIKHTSNTSNTHQTHTKHTSNTHQTHIKHTNTQCHQTHSKLTSNTHQTHTKHCQNTHQTLPSTH